jgi:hypothetical protein
LGRKLFIEAQASISVPSTLKCSRLMRSLASWRIAKKNAAATSCSISRARFFVNDVASKGSSTMSMSRNQRNNML